MAFLGYDFVADQLHQFSKTFDETKQFIQTVACGIVWMYVCMIFLIASGQRYVPKNSPD